MDADGCGLQVIAVWSTTASWYPMTIEKRKTGVAMTIELSKPAKPKTVAFARIRFMSDKQPTFALFDLAE